MKKTLIVLLLIVFTGMTYSQEADASFDALWEKVEKLESEALTKSALKIVERITAKAEQEKNKVESVKALLYASKYLQILEEDAQLTIINRFKAAIATSEFPTTNILESYMATFLWQYFEQNRYRFYNRSQTESKVDSTDFRTWDLATLFKEIEVHFEKSMAQPAKLQEIEVSDLEPLLIKRKGSEIYRPYLFDLLAQAALEFYTKEENAITRPAAVFEIKDPNLLCEAAQFIKIDLEVYPPNSLQLKALKIYQALTNFHWREKATKALVNVDLERLAYVYTHAIFDDKNLRYEEVLRNSASVLKPTEITALYSFEVAKLYDQLANNYQADSNQEYRWNRREALELSERIITDFPKSRAAGMSRALKAAIEQQDLQMVVEQHLSSNHNSKILVNYRNHDTLELAIYKATKNDLRQLNELYPLEKKLPYIKKLTLGKKWKVSLKNEKDYQNHATEILLPGLNNGLYIILATSGNSQQSFAYGHTQVTNMALLESRNALSHTFQLINRNNGKVYSGARLKLSYRENYERKIITKSFTTDDLGMVRISLSPNAMTSIEIEAIHEGEKAHFGEYYIRRSNGSQPALKEKYTTFFFTDRSIYRPGQPLYFKGIAIQESDNHSSIAANIKAKVILKNAQGQQLSEQELITNEFGSFKGEFMLPSSGLTGIYRLEAASEQVNLRGSVQFSVEEYKRPKFEVNFEPIKEMFKLNGQVRLLGKAMAYAGSNISGAKVVYRVKRNVRFPGWYYRSRSFYRSTPQEIAFGSVETDENGHFKLQFEALPDHSIPKHDLPIFTYEVTVDITDINGETRTASTLVNVGYHSLIASLTLPKKLSKEDKTNNLKLSTTNLNGQQLDAKGTVKFYKLTPPENILRKRPWKAPDYKHFTKEKFKQLFPYEAFEQEDDPANWEKGQMVSEYNFDTQKATEIILGNIKKWKSGYYLVELHSQDQFGMAVRDQLITYISGAKDKILADNQLFNISHDKSSYAVGEHVVFNLASNMEEVFVTLIIEKNKKQPERHLIRLNKNKKTLQIPIDKNDLGGFAVNYSFSAFNSFYNGVININIPYPSTDLQIETVTFRDKLRPSEEETWSFKIKGSKGDGIASEVLAGMYDASLDAFRDHSWTFNPLKRSSYYSSSFINAHQSFGNMYFQAYNNNPNLWTYPQQYYDRFNTFGLSFGYNIYNERLMKRASGTTLGIVAENAELAETVVADEEEIAFFSGPSPKEDKRLQGQADSNPPQGVKKSAADQIQIRKNLQETAFFFPQLMTDKEGNISFSFNSPEALTKWKLQLLAHNKKLESGKLILETVTQKELMVLPNTPRFLREGDLISLSTKIVNITEKALSGQAHLELTDAITGQDVSTLLFRHGTPAETPVKAFSIGPNGNIQLMWKLKIPANIGAIQYKITAKAGEFSDGEQAVLPVLSNRMLVTESMPMWVGSDQTKKFTLDKLKQQTSASLKHHQLTLEITSNPAWYAVQALPYLMEYPYECNEQIFARYFANSMAAYIVKANPKVQRVFEQWANSDALLSNLEKNQELKSLLIEETPWIRDAQSESEQKKRIALLFNLNHMQLEQANTLAKLSKNQMNSGAWAWFNGGQANRNITQHIATGIGQLKHLGIVAENPPQNKMIARAVNYLDDQFVREYKEMKKYSKDLEADHLSISQVHYLYMRTYFKDIKMKPELLAIKEYYLNQAQKYWTTKNLYNKGLIALVLHRNGISSPARRIVKSISENSITSAEMGMYWKENNNSPFWYQAPITTQALMIELFSETNQAVAEIDKLKVWLLKHKQTNRWKTTKATTAAVYALLHRGSDWLSITDAVEIEIGGNLLEHTKTEASEKEVGSGYFKTSWKSKEIKSDLAEVLLTKKGKGIAWGALYWQYFEDLDKITSSATPLGLEKRLFLKKNSSNGEVLRPIQEDTSLEVGDLIRVRIELRSDRPMEFIHMKDMRASGLEPVNVLSEYKWQDGLGYYQSTRDASTNFFIDFLPKGIFVFEYDLRVNNVGDFSNGITNIQSMYAPEFNSHGEGVRIKVDGSR